MSMRRLNSVSRSSREYPEISEITLSDPFLTIDDNFTSTRKKITQRRPLFLYRFFFPFFFLREYARARTEFRREERAIRVQARI